MGKVPSIRQETTSDFPSVAALVEAAFTAAEHSDGSEHTLVARLRSSSHFVPELSLVAELDGSLVGHILFTRISIDSETERIESLALAPVSVAPELQGRGIGGRLICRGHELARDLGFESVVLLGYPGYYPRFGYRPASAWDVRAPFEVPDENFMGLELREGALAGVSGVVRYAPEFGID